MKWYKLVGSVKTGQFVAENWSATIRDTFDAIRFPWNKPPSQVCTGDEFVVQAVGDTGLIAVQKVIKPPYLNPRRGPKGLLDNRWPHVVEVDTEFFCSPLKTAPKLRDVFPEFAADHAKRFRDGSHWSITDEEFKRLAGEVRRAGRPFAAASPGTP